MHTLQKALQSLSGKEEKPSTQEGKFTRLTGCPVAHLKNSLTAGPHGPVAMQDVDLLEKLTQFTREKIPARNVHALGTGAYGVLTITNDITKYTKAKLFNSVGKQTKLFVRFSGIFTEQGDPDTLRDPRGFALKFYTEEGNWDLLAINTPVFNVRDSKPGPDAVHSLKRDPRTSMWHPTQTWDYACNNPESLHQTLMIYSDKGGTPLSFRHMHAYGCNTFSFVNENNQRFWVKFHLNSYLGHAGLNMIQAKLVAGEDPNFLFRDLKEAIDRKDFPKWKLQCQIMPEEEGYQKYFAFDCTKVWKHADYPLIDIGDVELNANPINYFAEVEQVAFSPANIVPGIGFSPDKLLQGRLLLYDDAQHHRLGPNFKQYPINSAHGTEVHNNYYGGQGQLDYRYPFPHYYPSVFGGLTPDTRAMEPPLKCDGPLGYYDYPIEGTDEDYYSQPAEFLRVMSDEERVNLCENIAASFEKVPDEIVQKTLVHFNKINSTFANAVEQKWRARKNGTAPKTEAELLVQKLNQFLRGETKAI